MRDVHTDAPVADLSSSHLYTWFHWNPTHHKKTCPPPAPHNNPVTHLHPAAVVLLTHTYCNSPCCSSAWLICISCDSLHHGSLNILQHNRLFHVQNGGGEMCSEEPLDADQASMLGICFCYRPHCLLPWQQTEISLHTLHPSAFPTLKPSAPPFSFSFSLLPLPLPKVTTHFSPPSILGSLGNTLQLISCRWAKQDRSHD